MIGPRSPLCLALLFVTHAVAATPQCPPTDPLDYTVHLPHPDDCNQFYRCDHGIAKPERCPAGLHFNAVLQVCDWPYAANCQAGSSSSAPTSATTVLSTGKPEVVENATTSTQWSSSSSPNPTTVSTTEPTAYPPCPPFSETGEVIRIPHESNCKYYYICNNGYPALYQCRAGYQFSPTQLKCTPDSESDCGSFSTSHSSTTTTEDITTIFEETTTPLFTTTLQTTSTAEATSPEVTSPEATSPEATTSETSNTTSVSACPAEDDPNNIIRFPHESVCYYYYLCRNGFPILYQCPNNLHFNPILKFCQDKNEAGCEQSSSTTPWVTEITSTDVNPTDNTGTTGEDTSEQTVTTPNTTPTSEESTETTENTETATEQSTETSTQNSSDGTTSSETTSESVPTSEESTETTENPESATEQSTETATENSSDGTTSSEITSEGSTESEAQTTLEQPMTCPPVDDPNVIIRIPHESVCYYYYICRNGEPILYQCPDDLHFSSTARICQNKEVAGCEQFSSTTALTEGTENWTTTEEVVETTEAAAGTTSEDSSEVITEETTINNGPTSEEDLTTTEEILETTDNHETTVSHETTEGGAETSEDSSEVITEETTISVDTSSAGTPATTDSNVNATTEDNIGSTSVDLPSSCPAVDDPDNIIRIPHESVCYYYYICRNGEPILYQCPDDLHFSSTARICQDMELAGCEQFSSTTASTEGTENWTTTEEVVETTEGGAGMTSEDSSEVITEETTINNGQTSEEDLTTTEEILETTYNHETTVSHETTEGGAGTTSKDSSEVITEETTINNGQTSEEDLTTTEEIFETTDNNETTDNHETTVSHETTEGGAGTSEDSSQEITEESPISVDTSSAETPSTTDSNVSATTEDNIGSTSVDLPSSCPAVDDPDNIIRIPHESVCYYYYICRNGEPILYQCPEDLHFSSTARICQDKELAGCEQFSSTTALTEGTENWTTTEEVVETTVNHETTVSHETTEGGAGTTSEDSSEVSSEETTINNGPTSEEDLTTTEEILETTDNHETTVSHETTEGGAGTSEDSSQEITEESPISVDTSSAETPSTTDSNVSATTEDNIGSTSVDLPSSCPAVDNPDNIIRIPHESVCYYYYICRNGEPILYQCPDDLHFSSTARICQDKELAGCEQFSSTTALTEGTEDLTTTEEIGETSANPEITEGSSEITSDDVSDGSTLQSTTASIEQSSESTDHHETETTEATSIGVPLFCLSADDADNRFAHECVCHYYYTCKNGELVLTQCPEGLHFNSMTSVCQRKELAGCETSAPTENLVPQLQRI